MRSSRLNHGACRLLLLLVLLALPGCTAAQAGGLIRARQAYDDRDYRLAIRRADAATRFTTPAPEVLAEASLIKAKSLEGLGQRFEAAELYRYVVEHHPESPYAYQARGRLRALESARRLGIPDPGELLDAVPPTDWAPELQRPRLGPTEPESP